MDVDRLIDIVGRGGAVKTGVDVYNRKGVLLLRKDVLITDISRLLTVKKYGMAEIRIDPGANGGVWDKNGNELPLETPPKTPPAPETRTEPSGVGERIAEIAEIKKEAAEKYKKAKKNIKKVISDIRETGGEFEMGPIEETVTDIVDFLNRNDTAFSFLTKEIFSYDDYLYNHSVNVCTIGSAILNRFIEQFGERVNQPRASGSSDKKMGEARRMLKSLVDLPPRRLREISIGFFLHDVGKVLIPGEILNKPGRLTKGEFEIVKTHSYEKGMEILKKNKLDNPLISNIVKYHHGAFFDEETNCYPADRLPVEIPPFVKIAKLADVYDAMTSRRCYKEAVNPVTVVTNIYRNYANKDQLLQFILHSFVKIVGLYPPGGVLFLKNGQMVYVLDSTGPIVLPITDGSGAPLPRAPEPIDLEKERKTNALMAVDGNKPIKSPVEVYNSLPTYFKESFPMWSS